MKHFFNPTVEPFDHAICLRRFRPSQAVLAVQVSTELVELVLAYRSTLPQAEEAIGELFSVVREDRANANRAGTLQVSQEAPSIRRSLCLEDVDKILSRRAVDANEKGSAATSRRSSGADTSRRCGYSRARKP